MTTDDPWASSTPVPPLTPLQEYERELEEAGYGPTARARYIAESGDPEYAECEWDNNVIPAAEAAGIIPEPPLVEPPLDEQVRVWCHRATIRQFDAAHGNPAPWDLSELDMEVIKAESERLVVERGEELAAFLQANPRTGEEPVGAYDDRVFALLAQEPKIVVLCGSTRFMAEMIEANAQETAAGRIVLAPGCDLKTPHPLWATEADAEALKPKLDALHRAKIRAADQVLVVGDYIGDSTRAEIEYARQLGKTVRYTHPEVEETAK